MSTKLTIRWDGTAPGLQEHALSLSVWLQPLGTLLRAVRRAASNLDKRHADDVGQRGGRHTPAAAAIDLQITAVRDGCINLDLEATQMAPGQQTLERDLAARALQKVVRDIKSEAAGRRKNDIARLFLAQLPPGISEQGYRVEHHGVVLIEEKIVESVVETAANALPRTQRVHGVIAGVGFDPVTISFRTAKRQRITFPATDKLVQQALELRDQEVEAMCISGPRPRVVWVRAAGATVTPNAETRTQYMLKRWAKTLAILAE